MASKANGMEGWARAPPPKGSFLHRLTNAIYNSEEKSFLGRTPKRWGIVLTFYLVFYAVLAVMTAVCMGGLFYSLDLEKPTYLLKESLIGVNPGVAFRPLFEGSVFRYKTDNDTYQTYVEQLNDFFRPYNTDSWYTSKTGCNAEDNYGFPETPCFFIKVNRIVGWEPEFYDAADLPADMPDDLKEHIMALNSLEQKQVWITCWEDDGENSTVLEYPWGRGLPGMFYPFLSSEGYKSPVVALKINPPGNSQVIIRCRAWAKNIIYNKSLKEPSGYTRWQLYIEEPTPAATAAALT